LAALPWIPAMTAAWHRKAAESPVHRWFILAAARVSPLTNMCVTTQVTGF